MSNQYLNPTWRTRVFLFVWNLNLDFPA